MAIGFLVGLVVGWFQPVLAGTPVPEFSARLFMTFQMGAAFTIIMLFALNYLEVRRRAAHRLPVRLRGPPRAHATAMRPDRRPERGAPTTRSRRESRQEFSALAIFSLMTCIGRRPDAPPEHGACAAHAEDHMIFHMAGLRPTRGH